jgi:hypothetical protein
MENLYVKDFKAKKHIGGERPDVYRRGALDAC